MNIPCNQVPAIGHTGSRGFTLLEIMIVLLLMSLFFGLVSSNMISRLQRSALSTVSQDLVAAIRYTRAQALIKSKEQRILFDLANSTYTIPEKNQTVSVPEELNMKLVTAQIELQDETSGGIRFYPDGSSTGGSITLTGNTTIWEINVGWLGGNIEVQRKDHDTISAAF